MSSPLMTRRVVPVLAVIYFAGSLPISVARDSAAASCVRADSALATPDPGLYCLEMVAAPGLAGVSGAIDLLPAPSSSSAGVSPDGTQLYDLVISLDGLPDPSTLGAYAAYVAWATTPELSPMQRLGEVHNGRMPLGRVGWNKFLVIVTAEASAGTDDRRGRIVLRGNSPSSLMIGHGPSMLPGRPPPASHHHGEEQSGWPMPPMHPAVQAMIPGLEALEPPARPFLPGQGEDPASILEARPHRIVDLADGDTLNLEADLVRRTIGGHTFIMYGFNGQYPGPLLRVPQGGSLVVNFTNRIDLPTTVHWHGIRLDNRFDGVPDLTQAPVLPGESYRYLLRFPDAGIYWYHPHIREDIEQAMGLVGNLLVRSSRENYLARVNREEVLTLDDLLLAETGPEPFGQDTPIHALMGRFGNVFLVNGEPNYRLNVRQGEVIRFYFTNVSSVRTYNLAFEYAQLKVVGADGGRFEREERVQSVAIAPAERYVVEARFDRPGPVMLTNRVMAINHLTGTFIPEVDTLGRIEVGGGGVSPDHAAEFNAPRVDRKVTAELEPYRAWLDRPPDRELLLTLRVKDLPFGLEQILRLDTGYVNPVEWSGTMPMMDWLTTGRQVQWILRDRATGRENMDIDWRFHRGDLIKIRLINDRHTLHAMQHPIHLHGQRFLVLARNGVPTENLAWKDTVLVPAGGVTDILVDMSNPGRWMIHCHIAEHLETGMHAAFVVE